MSHTSLLAEGTDDASLRVALSFPCAPSSSTWLIPIYHAHVCFFIQKRASLPDWASLFVLRILPCSSAMKIFCFLCIHLHALALFGSKAPLWGIRGHTSEQCPLIRTEELGQGILTLA